MLNGFLPTYSGDTSNGGTALIEFSMYSRILVVTEDQFLITTDGEILIRRDATTTPAYQGYGTDPGNGWVLAKELNLPNGNKPLAWQMLQYGVTGLRMVLYYK